jgi:protein phosphatase
VVDATNVQPEVRRQLVELARAHDVLPVAVVLDLPERVCLDRNAARADRSFGEEVVKRQRDQLRRSLEHLGKEGFRKVHVLRSEQEVAEAVVVRERLLNDFRHERGPFDVVGDVHGCRSELERLLTELGYVLVLDEQGRPVDAVPPDQRKAVFVGDLVDRGPDSPGVLRLVMGMVAPATRCACRATTSTSSYGRCRAARSASATAWRPRWRSWRPSRRSSAPRWSGSATTWCRTWCSTTAGWSSPTRG